MKKKKTISVELFEFDNLRIFEVSDHEYRIKNKMACLMWREDI